jgi:membrane-bound lytic murein transglycosylase MltF
MIQINGRKGMKKRFKGRILALFLGITLLFFSYQELSGTIDDVADTEIQRIMIFIERYNFQMSNHLRFRIAKEIYWITSRDPNLDIPLLCGLITHESAGTWDPKIVSPAGAVGLMQVLPSTAREILISSFSDLDRDKKNEDFSEAFLYEVLSDPISNIRIGSRYLSFLIDRNGLTLGLMAYYMGERKMKSLLKKMEGELPLGSKRYLSSIFQFYQVWFAEVV